MCVMPPYSAIMSASQTAEWRKTKAKRSPFRVSARPVGRIAGEILSPSFRKRGFAQTSLLEQWNLIVGDKLAEHTLPEKISYPRRPKNQNLRSGESQFSRGGDNCSGILTLRVDGPFAIEIQHMIPQLLERINGFFGYRAVGRISLKQGPLPRRYERRIKRLRTLTDSEEKLLKTELRTISDDRLRHALLQLGRRVKGEIR